jgi:hypothetical protein
MARARLLVAAIAAALGIAAGTPAVAHAQQPCWKRVVADWARDGVISKQYSPSCLRKAMNNAPEDLKDYSSILDDIHAALLDALAGGGISNGPNSGGGPNNGGGTTSGPGANSGPEAPGNAPPRISAKAKRAVADAGTPASAPGHSREIPLPLILLGCVLAVAGLAVASPALIRRFRTRFPRLRPAHGSVRPPA